MGVKRSTDFLKLAFLMILIFGVSLYSNFNCSAALTEKIELGRYDVSFNIPNNCEIIEEIPTAINPNILMKYLLLKDNGETWFLLFVITENQTKGIINDENKINTIINFIRKELNLRETDRKKLYSEKCICENQNCPGAVTNNGGKEAFKAWYKDDAAKKEYIAYHYYIAADNSSHVIFMTDSNARKADSICRSSLVRLNNTK